MWAFSQAVPLSLKGLVKIKSFLDEREVWEPSFWELKKVAFSSFCNKKATTKLLASYF